MVVEWKRPGPLVMLIWTQRYFMLVSGMVEWSGLIENFAGRLIESMFACLGCPQKRQNICPAFAGNPILI
jgi:hypothetical protein